MAGLLTEVYCIMNYNSFAFRGRNKCIRKVSRIDDESWEAVFLSGDLRVHVPALYVHYIYSVQQIIP